MVNSSLRAFTLVTTSSSGSGLVRSPSNPPLGLTLDKMNLTVKNIVRHSIAMTNKKSVGDSVTTNFLRRAKIISIYALRSIRYLVD